MHWLAKSEGYGEGYPGVLMVPEEFFSIIFLFWFCVLEDEQEVAKSELEPIPMVTSSRFGKLKLVVRSDYK